MKGGSGLYINANNKDAFSNFMANSIPNFKTSGLTGMAYEFTLNPGINSDYLSLDVSNYGTPVRKLLVKISFILPLETTMSFIHKGEQRDIKTIYRDNFNDEINIQTDVYLKTMQYLQPLCPAIVYADIVDLNSPIIRNLLFKLPPEIKNQLSQYPGIQIGLIGMELMEPSENMFYVLQDHTYYISYLSKMLFALIELVVKTGYNHGDFHSGNFLFETHVNNYFKGKVGRVVVIDFGFTEKLPNNIYQTIKTLYKSKKYTDILTLLCDIPRKDGFDMNTWPNYLTTCLKAKPTFLNTRINFIVDKNTINQKIDELYISRELAINDLVSSFKPKHLPLSNSDKKNMYTGFIIDKPLVPLSFNFSLKSSFSKSQFDYFISKIFYILSVQPISDTEKLKYGIKACYNFVYLLDTNFTLEELPLWIALFYTGIFEKDWFSASSLTSTTTSASNGSITPIFGNLSIPKTSNQDILTIINNLLGNLFNNQVIYNAIVLQAKNLDNVRFDTIIDYIPENLLEKNKIAIVQGMTTPAPYEEPNIFAQQLLEPKIKIPATNHSSTHFEELPFNQTTGGKTRKKYYKKSKLKKRKSNTKRTKLYSRKTK